MRAQVQRHLEAITAYEGPELSLGDKLNFMRETRHAFGRTALVLSGGGALGAFHIVRAHCPFTMYLAAVSLLQRRRPSRFSSDGCPSFVPCCNQLLVAQMPMASLFSLGWLWAPGGEFLSLVGVPLILCGE